MVDGSGFVSLDFSATPGRGHHEERSRKIVHKSKSRTRDGVSLVEGSGERGMKDQGGGTVS